MKTSTAVAIGVGVGLVTGAVVGGATYAIYKGLKAALKHDSYSVSLNVGGVASGNKATIFFYPELKMAVVKVSPCKFTIGESGAILTTDPFPADLVADSAAGMTFKLPTTVFKGALAEGEYAVAKIARNASGDGVVVFSLATSAESEKQEVPLRAGTWEITSPIIITWEAK